ncbi:CocE/NonD family hydrolase [Kordiimonas sp.]
MRRAILAVFLSLPLCLGVWASEADVQTADPIGGFEKRTTKITMRDGIQLHTEIYRPKHTAAALPILLWRSPYNISSVDAVPGRSIFTGPLKELAEDGYIFVFQDIRGRHKSEGEFTMLRPLAEAGGDTAVDESTDAYDTIDWLVKNVAGNNGNVGMLGVSYPAWLSVMAAVNPHPALKAISPQASPADVYIGDDFFHNGAFHLSYGFEYVTFMERGSGADVFDFGTDDTYEWYLNLGSLKNVKTNYLANYDTSWDQFAAHPNYDAFWQKRAVLGQLPKIDVANLNVGGWYDAEDGYGPFAMYHAWQKASPAGANYLVLGPWIHGGWLGEGSAVGSLAFGSDTSAYFREQILSPWFAQHLKGQQVDVPGTHVFETGSNQWHTTKTWPAENSQTRRLYFHDNGVLSFEPPVEETGAADKFISDPALPVPYRPRPIENMFSGPGWSTWQTLDQRFVDGREDVLSWVTPVLDEDVVISGQILARLYAATTGSDADWVVKLIDVYPEDHAGRPEMGGYHLMVSGEILRGRFRNGLETPEAITPDRVEEYDIDLHFRQHRFKKGHRIMVQVQSSWFPLFDRNPQKFIENIFDAEDEDFRKAEHTILRSKNFPSYVQVNVSE